MPYVLRGQVLSFALYVLGLPYYGQTIKTGDVPRIPRQDYYTQTPILSSEFTQYIGPFFGDSDEGPRGTGRFGGLRGQVLSFALYVLGLPYGQTVATGISRCTLPRHIPR